MIDGACDEDDDDDDGGWLVDSSKQSLNADVVVKTAELSKWKGTFIYADCVFIKAEGQELLKSSVWAVLLLSTAYSQIFITAWRLKRVRCT